MMQYEELGTASLRSVFAACYFVSEKNTFDNLSDTDDMRVDIYEPRFVSSRGAYVIYF